MSLDQLYIGGTVSDWIVEVVANSAPRDSEGDHYPSGQLTLPSEVIVESAIGEIPLYLQFFFSFLSFLVISKTDLEKSRQRGRARGWQTALVADPTGCIGLLYDPSRFAALGVTPGTRLRVSGTVVSHKVSHALRYLNHSRVHKLMFNLLFCDVM